MSGLINELVALLNEQAENYENLLALSAEKKDVIVANNIEMLQKITSLENNIVGGNQRLEKKRISIVKDIANVLNKNEDELTLRALAELIVNQPEHPELLLVSQRIKKAVEELHVLNDQNKTLINNSLDYIDFTMNLIRGAMSGDTPYYTSKGDRVTDGNTFFDAKQ